MRDCWIEYMDSAAYGSSTFAQFMEHTLAEQGVQNLFSLRGAQRTAAAKSNRAFIIKQRADMRTRLVHAAMAGKLAWGSAQLAGFVESASETVDLTELDDEL
jgi:hypothetical protein